MAKCVEDTRLLCIHVGNFYLLLCFSIRLRLPKCALLLLLDAPLLVGCHEHWVKDLDEPITALRTKPLAGLAPVLGSHPAHANAVADVFAALEAHVDVVARLLSWMTGPTPTDVALDTLLG